MLSCFVLVWSVSRLQTNAFSFYYVQMYDNVLYLTWDPCWNGTDHTTVCIRNYMIFTFLDATEEALGSCVLLYSIQFSYIHLHSIQLKNTLLNPKRNKKWFDCVFMLCVSVIITDSFHIIMNKILGIWERKKNLVYAKLYKMF